jgi:signal transduction histidine kinase/ligand-binding sensor domain-containing protein
MRLQIGVALAVFMVCMLAPWPAGSAPGAGQSVFYPGTSLPFEQITVNDGLSQNSVMAVLQDRQNYLWIGTQDGLDRYDGYSFTHFKNDPQNPNSLSFNSVIALYEDHQGFLWIGTWGGGLNRYDPATGRFDRFLTDPADPASLSHSTVTSIAQDQDDRLWVGTLGGLDLYYPATGKFIHFHPDVEDPASLSSDAISAILPAPDGTLWIGTGAYGMEGNGVNHFDPSNGETVRLKANGSCLLSPNVSSLVFDRNGSLWVGHGGAGLPGGGIDQYDPASGNCHHFDIKGAAQFTSGNVTSLRFDRDNRLWAALWGGGLLRMEPDQPGWFAEIRHDPNDPESLSSDNISALLQDRSGVLWIGTLDAGLEKLTLQNLQFRTYKNNPAVSTSLSSNRVSAFAETRDGRIWVGTTEAGLDSFDPLTGQFTHYRNIPSNPYSLSSNRVMSLYADLDGSLWVGTVNSGLNHYDPRSERFQHYHHDSADPYSLIDDEVTYINRDGGWSLWVAAMGGLSRMDPGGTQFNNFTGLSGAPVTLMTDGGDLWIGTWGGGAARLSLALPGILPPDATRLSVRTLDHDASDPNSLSENSVWAIYKTAEGAFWFGTASGLNRYDPKTGAIRIFTEKNGLPSASILGIVGDDTGHLWITTANGLSRFDPLSETFRNFDRSDGLQGNEFNSNASFVSPTTGEIYVGGTDGFTVFDPNRLISNVTPPRVVITDFTVFNEAYPYDPSGNSPINLNYNQDYISVGFAGLDFHAPAKNTYAYMLEGVDADWVQAGTRHTATYSNLRPGSYTFRVRAANSDGTWGPTQSLLRIEMVPPFWQRWQYQGGFILGLIAIVYAGFQWRLREVRRNERKLEQRIAERTEELNQANILLREKAAQDAVTAERTRLARELHDAVTQTLFSATLIADVLPDLWGRNRAEGDRRLEELRQLTRGALAEMRTLLVELRPNALIEVPLPTLLKQFTEALAGRARLDIQLNCSGSRKLPADVQIAFYRIAQEGLNNAVKHATASQIRVDLELGASVRLGIVDNGAGFDKGRVTADHLGLRIMRERAEAIGAELSVDTAPGRGTEIRVAWK